MAERLAKKEGIRGAEKEKMNVGKMELDTDAEEEGTAQESAADDGTTELTEPFTTGHSKERPGPEGGAAETLRMSEQGTPEATNYLLEGIGEEEWRKIPQTGESVATNYSLEGVGKGDWLEATAADPANRDGEPTNGEAEKQPATLDRSNRPTNEGTGAGEKTDPISSFESTPEYMMEDAAEIASGQRERLNHPDPISSFDTSSEVEKRSEAPAEASPPREMGVMSVEETSGMEWQVAVSRQEERTSGQVNRSGGGGITNQTEEALTAKRREGGHGRGLKKEVRRGGIERRLGRLETMLDHFMDRVTGMGLQNADTRGDIMRLSTKMEKGCTGMTEVQEENRRLKRELQLMQAEQQRLKGQRQTQQEEEVYWFARSRHAATAERNEMGEKEAEEDHAVGNEARRRWNEGKVLPEGWQGFTEGTGRGGKERAIQAMGAEVYGVRKGVEEMERKGGRKNDAIYATVQEAAREAAKARQAVEKIQEEFEEWQEEIADGLSKVTRVVERMERGVCRRPLHPPWSEPGKRQSCSANSTSRHRQPRQHQQGPAQREHQGQRLNRNQWHQHCRSETRKIEKPWKKWEKRKQKFWT